MSGLLKRDPALPWPCHVAIIMDGNGRWAAERNLPRTLGHRRGVEAVRRTIVAAEELGIRYLTVFGFSSENWRRPADEVEALMRILRLYLRAETADLHRRQVRLKVIGDRGRLAPDIRALIDSAEALTADNTGVTFVVALSYGGQQDIAQAARTIAVEAAAGRLDPDSIDPALFQRYLQTDGLPEPDLVIRTSGEKRISNFLLWQLAYAELVFVDRLWPDFGRDDLESAVLEYQRRDRRFGTTGAGGSTREHG